ncbi:MAG: hypothetical protein M3281_03190, partial [Chloroflexota bacterium]|nr:hypothetical protein [Chloroflexota bacterium]
LPFRVVAAAFVATPTPQPAREYHPWAQLPTEVALTFPRPDQPADLNVPILGSASLPLFERYAVEYGEGDAPSAWQPVGSPRRQPVQEGVLELWDTSPLADGIYTLRLTVTDSRGQQQSAHQFVRIQHSGSPRAEIRRQ